MSVLVMMRPRSASHRDISLDRETGQEVRWKAYQPHFGERWRYTQYPILNLIFPGCIWRARVFSPGAGAFLEAKEASKVLCLQ
jgi:hypothetical protein